jgi:hypothetical protein
VRPNARLYVELPQLTDHSNDRGGSTAPRQPKVTKPSRRSTGESFPPTAMRQKFARSPRNRSKGTSPSAGTAAQFVAISVGIFMPVSSDTGSMPWLEVVITFAGRRDNVAVPRAALIALTFNFLMVVAAIVSVMLTVPKER